MRLGWKSAASADADGARCYPPGGSGGGGPKTAQDDGGEEEA